jgi:hypothetical protein
MRTASPARPAVVAFATFALTVGAAGAALVPATVTPKTGKPTSTFVVAYTAPHRTGVVGTKHVYARVSVTRVGPQTGCLSQADATAAAAKRGQRVRVKLDPAAREGRWCIGRFTGRVDEYQTAICPPGLMCPLYVRPLGTIARFTLVVRAP